MKTLNKQNCHYPAGLDNPVSIHSNQTKLGKSKTSLFFWIPNQVGNDKRGVGNDKLKTKKTSLFSSSDFFFRPHLGFTLVELIVVISILAILGTIAFLSFTNYSSKARDSSRMADTSNLSKGLEIYQVQAGKYLAPEQITGTGIIGTTEVAYLGTIQNQISTLAKISKTPTDPLSGNYYIYGTTADYRQYQIATTLENSIAFNSTLPLGEGLGVRVYADSPTYQARVIGNYKGLIKFNSGTTTPITTWIANIPSLIYNSGANLLAQTNLYYSINKSSNLPYQIKDSISGNLTPNQILLQLTGTAATLTGIDITSITTQTGILANSGTLLTLGYDLSLIEKIILGTSSTASTPTPTYSCIGSLVIANATITNNTNLIQDTAYQTTNSANNCYYTCKAGYSGTNCEITPPTCPTGFVHISGSENIDSQTKGWCVAKYEMTPLTTAGWTQDATYKGWICKTTSITDTTQYDCSGPVTSKSGTEPVTYISRNEAQNACATNLKDSNGNTISNGKLLTVQLWSKIARDIEAQAINWSSNTIGNGNLSRGHASGTPNNTLAGLSNDTVSNPTNYYSNRAWKLSNGNVIHDFAGNVWEWYYDMHASSCSVWAELTTNTFSYNGISLEPLVNTYNSTNGIGQICSANATIPTTPTYASFFGGSWGSAAGAGVFASYWNTYSPSTDRRDNIGFRCIAPAN